MKKTANISRNKHVYQMGFDEFLSGKWLSLVQEYRESNKDKMIDIEYKKGDLSIQLVSISNK